MNRPPLTTSPQEIARLYLAGNSVPKVAALVKLSTARVYATLVRLEVPRRRRGAVKGASHNGKLTIQQREQLRADLRSGKFPTMRAIARKYGVTHECVRQNAVAAGVTRYSMALRVEAARERERLRKSAVAAAITAREAAREERRKKAAALWRGGASVSEIGRILGSKNRSNAAYLIAEARKHSPADFPFRAAKKATPEEMQERKRARAARVAARREQTETRRTLLAKLWQSGATRAEISGVFGVSVSGVEAMVHRYRRRWPGEFPPRTPPNRRAG